MLHEHILMITLFYIYFGSHIVNDQEVVQSFTDQTRLCRMVGAIQYGHLLVPDPLDQSKPHVQ